VKIDEKNGKSNSRKNEIKMEKLRMCEEEI
jgi:hypothetical protein